MSEMLPTIALALYQPDIPGNAGALMRLAACLDFELHIIEPAGFRLDDAALRRAGMDYRDKARLVRHVDWDAFEAWRRSEGRRLLLMTTKAETSLYAFAFHPGDIILMGRESSGVPDTVHAAADHRLTIPMAKDMRSLNMALSAAMVVGEALRQVGK